MTDLKRLILRKGVKLTDLGRDLGVNQGNISRIVNGRQAPSRGLAEDIAAVLGITPDRVMWPDGMPGQVVEDVPKKVGLLP